MNEFSLEMFKKKTELFLKKVLPSNKLVLRLSSIILHNVECKNPEGAEQSPPLYTFKIAQELGLSPEISEALTLTTTLFYSTADYADDLADGDLEEASEIALNNICLLLFLHQQSILSIPELNASKKEALVELFSTKGIEMALGQEEDFRSNDLQNVDPIEIARKKGGAEASIFFAVPALAAGLPPKIWMDFGSSFGTLIQVLSDYLDLFLNPHCEDWVDGKITLPILLGLQNLEEAKFLKALWEQDRASSENQAQALWHLAQAKVENGLKEFGEKELSFLRNLSLALKQPLFLENLIRESEETMEAICESLEEFRAEKERLPLNLSFTSAQNNA